MNKFKKVCLNVECDIHNDCYTTKDSLIGTAYKVMEVISQILEERKLYFRGKTDDYNS